MYSRSFRLAALVGVRLILSLALCAQTRMVSSNSSGLIQSAVEHRWRDEAKTGEFTYIELWQNKNMNKLGQLIVDEAAKFESINLGGKAYLRMVEENGVPLQGQDARLEEQSYDSSIATGSGKSMQERIAEIVSRSVDLGLNLDLLPLYFHTAIIGMNSVNGRDAFEFLCTPRTDIKPREKADAKGLPFKVRVWIDAKDVTFARVEAELLKDRNHMRSGTTAEINWAPVDGIWLPRLMKIHGRAKEGRSIVTFDTEYQYSDYRKFHSESRIVGTPIPIAPNAPPRVDSPQR
jgi:hypothetical protein